MFVCCCCRSELVSERASERVRLFSCLPWINLSLFSLLLRPLLHGWLLSLSSTISRQWKCVPPPGAVFFGFLLLRHYSCGCCCCCCRSSSSSSSTRGVCVIFAAVDNPSLAETSSALRLVNIYMCIYWRLKVSPGALFSLLLAPTFFFIFFLPEFFFVVSRKRLAVSLSVDIICVSLFRSLRPLHCCCACWTY